MPDRFFFDQDMSSHWYMIPASMREVWDKYTVNDLDDEDYDALEEFERMFSEYRIDGGPGRYTFENPTVS